MVEGPCFSVLATFLGSSCVGSLTSIMVMSVSSTRCHCSSCLSFLLLADHVQLDQLFQFHEDRLACLQFEIK